MSIDFIYPNYLWLLLLVPATLGLGLLRHRMLSVPRLAASMFIRLIILSLLISALAGIQLRLPSNLLTTIFVIDSSDSITETERARGQSFINQTISSAMDSGDQAAIVLFGEDAVVERLASEDKYRATFDSIPITTRTDIAGALQLAMALFPQEGAKRLILLSDGQENLKHSIDQAELASVQDIQLLYFPLGVQTDQVEVIMERLEAPGSVRQGQDYSLTATINSSASMPATLHFYADGSLIESREVRLQPNNNKFFLEITSASDPSGNRFRRFRAQIIPQVDTRLQNNDANAFTVVHGPPNILLVEGEIDEGANFFSALQAGEMQITRIAPEKMPNTISGLAAYDAVVIINAPAAALPSGVLELLPVYVRDLGKGLLMLGGDHSFGAGGYLRTPLEKALPVDMDVRNKEFQANLALVLAVDKSGSMGRCHCDDPDLNQTYSRAEVGQPKVDIAKEAVMRAAGALGDQDYLGVVAFDSAARWALPVDRLVDPLALEQAIGRFQAEGQTNLSSGVQAAYQALQDINANRKHIILLTDGWIHRGDLTSLAQEMNDQGITLSVVAAGGGAAEYLESLALTGGGRYYPAADILGVPDIFLKETITSVGEYIIEAPFYALPSVPSPILQNIDITRLPPLLGYNGTTAKNTARQVLITPQGDPLLATWQYGLGRAAVWTSDLKGQWATQWVIWPDFPRFSAQLINWILPNPQPDGLYATARQENGGVVVRLEAQDQNGIPLNFLQVQATIVDPDLQTSQISLQQVGAGEYQANLPTSDPGVYLVRLGANQEGQSLGQISLGAIVPYSPEYKTTGINQRLLLELARITGGAEIVQENDAFAHNLAATSYPRDIWYSLLLIVAFLFPLDVAVRRIMLGPKDLKNIKRWINARLPSTTTPTHVDQPAFLQKLFQARTRARQGDRQTAYISESQQADPVRQPKTSEHILPDDSNELETASSGIENDTAADIPPEDTLKRLHEAKKRTRR